MQEWTMRTCPLPLSKGVAKKFMLLSVCTFLEDVVDYLVDLVSNYLQLT